MFHRWHIWLADAVDNDGQCRRAGSTDATLFPAPGAHKIARCVKTRAKCLSRRDGLNPEWHVLRAAHVLRGGGLVVNATEAVFGIAANAHDAEACAKVRQLKQRGLNKAFLVVAADVNQLTSLVSLSTPLWPQILATWPGPHTWVLPARRSCPAWLPDRGGFLAVRITGHPQARQLAERAGAFISTSANPANRAPARTLLAARRYFGKEITFYLPGELGGSLTPTQIRHGLSGALIR